MTITDVQNTHGFSPDTLKAALTFLRENVPFLSSNASADPTASVNNEGRLQGYFRAVNDLQSILLPQKEQKPQAPIQPYSGSQFPTPKQ